MLLSTLDLAFRGATVALLLVLAASLLRDFKCPPGASPRPLRWVRPRMPSPLRSARLAVSIWHAPLIALSTGDAVVLWLFTRALLDDAFVPRWWHALIWAAVAAYSFVSCLWIAPGRQPVHHRGQSARARFIVLAVAQTITSWSADLVERRRRVRVFIVSAAVLYGGVNALLQISISGADTAAIANVANAAVLTGIVAAICYAMMQVDGGDLFPARRSRADVPAAVAAARRVPPTRNWSMP